MMRHITARVSSETCTMKIVHHRLATVLTLCVMVQLVSSFSCNFPRMFLHEQSDPNCTEKGVYYQSVAYDSSKDIVAAAGYTQHEIAANYNDIFHNGA